jgi:hypothetical protein
VAKFSAPPKKHPPKTAFHNFARHSFFGSGTAVLFISHSPLCNVHLPPPNFAKFARPKINLRAFIAFRQSFFFYRKHHFIALISQIYLSFVLYLLLRLSRRHVFAFAPPPLRPAFSRQKSIS